MTGHPLDEQARKAVEGADLPEPKALRPIERLEAEMKAIEAEDRKRLFAMPVPFSVLPAGPFAAVLGFGWL